MARTRYLSVNEVPARPDPITGLPRPPHAPGFFGQDTPFKEDLNRERDPELAPEPPDGQGPVLAWYQASRRGAKVAAWGCGLILGILLTITRGTAWLIHLKYWPVWVFIAAFSVAIYFITRRERCSAGADWLSRGDKWVKTYELVKIKCHSYPPAGAWVHFQDADGRKLRYKLVDFGLDDRLLWDLTYNGVVHSVIAGGAKTNSLARRAMGLPARKPDPE